MLNFIQLFALALSAAMLSIAGAHHARSPRAFTAVLREQGVLPHVAVPTVALCVITAELLLAAGSIAALVGRAPARSTLTGVALMAAVFLTYLAVLLRRPHRASTACGCSPLEAPLSRASLVPAFALLACAGIGALSGAEAGLEIGPAWRALPVLGGLVLALVVFLIPSTRPSPSTPERS